MKLCLASVGCLYVQRSLILLQVIHLRVILSLKTLYLGKSKPFLLLIAEMRWDGTGPAPAPCGENASVACSQLLNVYFLDFFVWVWRCEPGKKKRHSRGSADAAGEG